MVYIFNVHFNFQTVTWYILLELSCLRNAISTLLYYKSLTSICLYKPEIVLSIFKNLCLKPFKNY